MSLREVVAGKIVERAFFDKDAGLHPVTEVSVELSGFKNIAI